MELVVVSILGSEIYKIVKWETKVINCVGKRLGEVSNLLFILKVSNCVF